MKQLYFSLFIVIAIIGGAHAQNVGIGTTSPAKKLDVAGDINAAGNYYIENSSGDIDNVFRIDGFQDDLYITAEGDPDGAATGIYFRTAAANTTATDKMYIASDGSITMNILAGTGNRMVIANSSGQLSTQAIPVDTDDQTLSLNGNDLTIADGNTVDLSNVGGDDLGDHSADLPLQMNNNNINNANNVYADRYYTDHGGGDVLQVGDDAWILDDNSANMMFVRGQQNSSLGGIGFGDDNDVFLRENTDGYLQIYMANGGGYGSAGQVLKSDGTNLYWGTDDNGVVTEVDPQVGSNTTNYVPRWDGSALISGIIRDDGTNAAIGTGINSDVKLNMGGRIAMNDNEIRLRTASDANHVLTYSNSFGGYSFDGPLLMGHTSGVLGTNNGGDKAVLYWNNDGEVGINTDNPDGRLQVNNSASEYMHYTSSGNLTVHDAESSTGEVRLGAAWDRPGVYSSNGLHLFTASGEDIIFGNNDTEYMRLASDGDLGIGTTNPGSYKLNVNGYMNITQGARFDCASCGSQSNLFGSSDWGHLTIQGRVISADNNIHLSPPDGSRVVINNDYRAAGGGTSGAAGLQVESLAGSGTRTVVADASGVLSTKSAPTRSFSVSTNMHPSEDDYSYTSVLNSCDDDGTYNINMGFNVTIDGVNYSNVWISTNGVLGFGNSPSSWYGNSSLPTGISNDPMLFFHWDDHAAYRINYLVTGSSPGRICHIFWEGDESISCNGSDMDIYITIHEGGVLSVRYRGFQNNAATRGRYATFGFQKAGGSSTNDFVQLGYNVDLLDDNNNDHTFFSIDLQE